MKIYGAECRVKGYHLSLATKLTRTRHIDGARNAVEECISSPAQEIYAPQHIFCKNQNFFGLIFVVFRVFSGDFVDLGIFGGIGAKKQS